MEDHAGLRIVRLEPALLGSWLDFFDARAFSGNPDWKQCYCTFYYKPARGTGAAGSRITNRNRAVRMIREGTMAGYLGLPERRGADRGGQLPWPLALYERLGFEIVEEGKGLVVRKALGGGV